MCRYLGFSSSPLSVFVVRSSVGYQMNIRFRGKIIFGNVFSVSMGNEKLIMNEANISFDLGWWPI